MCYPGNRDLEVVQVIMKSCLSIRRCPKDILKILSGFGSKRKDIHRKSTSDDSFPMYTHQNRRSLLRVHPKNR